ncbi:unnamed protein product [Phytophthora fragariaefolia]|uniref:Unnamed protein product n=1 Tax=Phytophthora fragariaefolia TaxID=1490495 RepID=A0A9W6TKK6_9STRA|nr:unnamed protein product [Phytophthora fragariaefolia]
MTTLIQDGPGDPKRDRPEWTHPDSKRLVELELRPGERYAETLDARPDQSAWTWGVPTYISESARIKITLGPRIVYVMTVYAANIDEGLGGLLGMNFMYAAGVRLSVREGHVQLSDEETFVMCGNPARDRPGLDLPVFPERSLYLPPGEHAIVKIRYGYSNPQRKVVWAGRGDRWVTQIIYGAKSWAVAVKVVNTSPRMVWIDTGTAVARIVEFGCFPSSGRWWPTKLMLRPLPGSTQVRIARLPGRPDAQDENQSSRATETGLEYARHWLTRSGRGSVPFSVRLRTKLPRQAMLGTPLYKLKQEYARCMRVNLEDLDLEPAVYIQEGSVLMSQLCDELAMLPELNDLSPECDITMADVGEPGRTTPDEDRKLRTVLEKMAWISECALTTFLGSLNYYHKFIEDFPVVAAVLYELTDEQVRAGRNLSRAKEAFEILKRKIVPTPLLRHPDRTKSYVIIPHANKWVACAVLGQEYDGVIQPVRFTGRVLIDSEVRYHIAEKEVVAIMRVLEVFRTIVENFHIVVYTRYSVLSWLMKSKSADGRCVRWGLTLSHWDLEVRKVQRDEDGLAAIVDAGITPREHLDEVAEALTPAKGRVKGPPLISVEMLDDSYTGYVLSFDGAAKTSTPQGSCGCVVWKLPGWHALSAHGFILDDVTVNDAEYHGFLKGMELMSERNVQDLVVVGDSRIVIQQVQGLINCNQPNLQRRLAAYEALKVKFKSVKLVHVKRDYNQTADYLTSKTLTLGESWQVEDAAYLRHLEQVSKIPEKLMKSEASLNVPVHEESGQNPPDEVTLNDDRSGPESAPLPMAARVMAAVVTRSRTQEEDDQREPMGPLEYQGQRWRRIKAHQESDLRSKNLISS